MNITHLLIGAAVGYGICYAVSSSATLASNYPTVFNYSDYIVAGAGVVAGLMKHNYRQVGYGVAIGSVLHAIMSGTADVSNS